MAFTAEAVAENSSAILDLLAQLGGRQFSDDLVVREGNRLVVPETMDLVLARDTLTRVIEDQEMTQPFSRQFKYRPWDGAVALNSVLKRLFGTAGVAARSIFGPEVNNISINVGPDEQRQIPWGRFEFPPLQGRIQTGNTYHPEFGAIFTLTVTVPKKYAAQVEGLFKAVEDELEAHSIYRGKAITGAAEPEFINPFSVNRSEVVYSDEVMAQLEANVWSLPRYAPQSRALGISLKRSVLFAGPYGTGKTLGALLTAQEAVSAPEPWTFIMVRPGRDDMFAALQTAALYQPAVVFIEDIDVPAQNGDTDFTSRLLDAFDGLTGKGAQLLLVLTTNFPERIQKGLLRPGRIDSVITIAGLDRNGFERLVRATVPEYLLSSEVDFDRIAEAFDGFLPAFAKEAVSRAMRYVLARTGGKPDVITTDDLVKAADGLRPQLDLMNNAGEGVKRPLLEEAFHGLVNDVVTKVAGVDGSDESVVSAINGNVDYEAGRTRDYLSDAMRDTVVNALDETHIVDNDGDRTGRRLSVF